MKKLFTILVAGLFVLNVSAQKTDAGTIYFTLGVADGSGLNIGSTWQTGIEIDGDDEDAFGIDYWDDDVKGKENKFNMNMGIGTFLTDGLLAGVGVLYSRTANISEQEDRIDWDGDIYDLYSKSTSVTMGIGPFLRYYVSIGDASSFFLGASYHYSRQQSESEYEIDYQIGLGDYDEDDESDPIDQSSVNFSAGLSVAISENIAIEPSISFSMIRVKTEEEVETNIYDMWGDYDYTIYTDEERIDFLNNFSFGVAASFFF